MHLTQPEIDTFQQTVWDYFRENEREMPWRSQPLPYYVLVSELMLQQTQVSRVIPKFEAFITLFPDIYTLASAPLADVLTAWSGLGYNRRAKFLHQTAQTIAATVGELPRTTESLMALPGIGENTAGAIMNYAYNIPVVFVETNIRTVYLHHFFTHSIEKVTDKELRQIAAQTIDKEDPRRWHWALMDYGTYLKKEAGGRLEQSRHYKKQSPLRGSVREMRGIIIKLLTAHERTEKELEQAVGNDPRFQPALLALLHEGLVEQTDKIWYLTGYQQPS